MVDILGHGATFSRQMDHLSVLLPVHVGPYIGDDESDVVDHHT